MKRLILVLVACVFVGSLTAQEAPPQAKPGAKPAAPAVSDVTRLQIENAALRQQLSFMTGQLQLCQAQNAPGQYKAANDAIQTELETIVKEFEKQNPGWTLDLKTVQPKKKGGD
jgi:hypothetical protein